jgi:hypothetical protein
MAPSISATMSDGISLVESGEGSQVIASVPYRGRGVGGLGLK